MHKSCDVIEGHKQSIGNYSGTKRDTSSRMASLCLSRQDASIDMQFDLLYGSSCDLDLSNFQLDLPVSKSSINVELGS